MNTIIAGRFEEQAQADQAVAALNEAGFLRARTATIFVNPPGQHDRHGTPRDPDASAGAHHAGTGAAAGAAAGTGIGTAVGAATIPILGPAGPLAGAAIGAYVGSFAGALAQMDDHQDVPERSVHSDVEREEGPPRKSGLLVAVYAELASEQAVAVGILRGRGAADIEHAHGSITDSQWNDFDPLRLPELISVAA